jgi:phosphinothricin acetyltransferase
MSNYSIVQCSLEEHGEQILAILNEAIETSTALYDYKPRTIESMTPWFTNKSASGFPVIGAVSTDGKLLGFGTFGQFRVQPAYKYTVEHSVYVHKDHRGEGLGKVLMLEVINAAKKLNLHAIIGAIDAENVGSMALHEKLGFKHVGTLPEVGFKFGRWLDVAFYQLTLETPTNPQDG